jgi:Flp pilus assembly protein TadG
MRHMTCGRSMQRGDRGTTTLEFTLTIFTFLVVVLGVMEMAMMLYTYTVVSAAAKEGVRYAAVVAFNPNTEGTGDWSVAESPANCPFSTRGWDLGCNQSITNTCDPTGVIQCKVYDYARYSLQAVSNTNMTVNVTFQTDNDSTFCPAGTSPLWTVPCPVRIAVSYRYAPLFGIPLTPRMTAVAEGRMLN